MKYLVLLSLIFGLVQGFGAHAGTEGHGGGAMVCRNQYNVILNWPELLDLWEVQALANRELLGSRDVPNGLIEARLKNFDSYLYEKSMAMLPIVRNSITLVKDGVAISPPTDAKNKFFKAGCKLEGLALYDDEAGRLYVDNDIFRNMNPLQQAALLWHETIYKVLREQNSPLAEDSRYTRKVIGYLFSKDLPKDAKYGVPRNARFCSAGEYEFYIYPENGRVNLQFTVMDSSPVFGQTLAMSDPHPVLTKLINGEPIKDAVNHAKREWEADVVARNSVRIVVRSNYEQKVLTIMPYLDYGFAQGVNPTTLEMELVESRKPKGEGDSIAHRFYCK